MYDNPKYRKSDCSLLIYDIPKSRSSLIGDGETTRRSSSGISSIPSSYTPPIPQKVSAVPSPPRALPPPPPSQDPPQKPRQFIKSPPVDSELTHLCTALLDAIDRGENDNCPEGEVFSIPVAYLNARFRTVLGSARDHLIRLAPDPRVGTAAAKYALEVGAVLGVVESSRDHVTRALAHRRHEGTRRGGGTLPRRLSTLVRSFRQVTGAMLKNNFDGERNLDRKSMHQQQLRIMLRAVLLVKSRLAEMGNMNEQRVVVLTGNKCDIYESIPKLASDRDESSDVRQNHEHHHYTSSSTIDQLISGIRTKLILDRGREGKTPFEIYRTAHEKLCASLDILEGWSPHHFPAPISFELLIVLARDCVDALSRLDPNHDEQITTRFRLIVDQVESLSGPEKCTELSSDLGLLLLRTLHRASALTFDAVARDPQTT